MKNLNEMTFRELMDLKENLTKQIVSTKDENIKEMLKSKVSDVIDELKMKNVVYETIEPDSEEEQIEKANYVKNSDYIKNLSIDDFDEDLKEEKRSKIVKRVFKTAYIAVGLGAVALASAIALTHCSNDQDSYKKSAIESPLPEETATVDEKNFNAKPKEDEEYYENEEAEENEDVLSSDSEVTKEEIEEAAIEYYNKYKDSLNKNFDGKQISEQDIINIGYLINDREDLLSYEALTDACNNIENGVGYESSKFLSITHLLDNKETSKQMLSKSQYKEWVRNFNDTVNNFKPAKLSKLIVKNDTNLTNIKQIEEGIEGLYNSIKKNGVITKGAKERYNDLLVRLHHNNAYKNYSAVSNDTENNDNLGFRYFMNAASYAVYDIGTTINPHKETIKSSSLVDPITGKKFDVKLTTNDKHELSVLNRISKGENTKKLIHEYTKLRNELVLYGYKDDMCYDRNLLQKQVKQNEKSNNSSKILNYK